MTVVQIKCTTANLYRSNVQIKCAFLFTDSCIIGKLETDRTIPTDITVHAHRGTTTIEKLEKLKKYFEAKMKTVILKDGTNSFLEFKRKPGDVFEQYKQPVNLCREKFNPDKFYLMRVITMKNLSANMAKIGCTMSSMT